MKRTPGKDFEGAVTQLRDDVRSVPDEVALHQTRERIKADAREVDATGKRLATEVRCVTKPST